VTSGSEFDHASNAAAAAAVDHADWLELLLALILFYTCVYVCSVISGHPRTVK